MSELKEIDIEKALKFRHPEIVVNVTTISNEGIVDITPIGWAMLGSSNPRTWAIGVAKRHFSHKSIIESKEFTICLPSADQAVDTLYCGTNSAWKVNKFENTKFKTKPAMKISTPLIEGSLICFECKLIDQMETADHTIFLGKILCAHATGKTMGLINLGNSKLVKFKRGKK